MNPRKWLLVAAIAGIIVSLLVLAEQQSRTNTTTANRLQIENNIAQYAYRWDQKDAKGFAKLFTEDAVVERWIQGEQASLLEGREALLNYALASYAGRLADRQTRHHMSSIIFTELSDSSAVTENLVLITHQTEASRLPQVVSAGIYRMTWRMTDEGWKIAKRVLFVDQAPAAAS